MTDPASRRPHFAREVARLLRDRSKTIEQAIIDALEAAYVLGQDSIAGPRPVTIRDDRGGVTTPAPIGQTTLGARDLKGRTDGRS